MSKINERRKLLKQNVIEENRLHNNDTGSANVKRALLQHKLISLQKHQQEHKQDQTIKRVISKIKSQISKLKKQIVAK